MTEATIAEKTATKADQWRELIAEQQRSGVPVKQFCKERGLTPWSFYDWRKRLRETTPVRFALSGAGSGASRVRFQRRSGNRIYQWRAITNSVRGRLHDIAYRARRAAHMIHLPASVRVYLCLTACDMRKSFDGLHALVREHVELDPFAGHLIVFASRRRDRVKILYWDRDGFAIWSKRLEGWGRTQCPSATARSAGVRLQRRN